MTQLSNQEVADYSRAQLSHICNQTFSADDIKIHNHCHFTGKNRGPGHNSWNLNYVDDFMRAVS